MERDAISKKRMHVVDKRRIISTKLAQLLRVTEHRYTKVKMERESKKGIAKAPELCPRKRFHAVRNKTSQKVRIREKSKLRPQLSGFHKRGFQATAENAI